jgi:hypothetical protein
LRTRFSGGRGRGRRRGGRGRGSRAISFDGHGKGFRDGVARREVYSVGVGEGGGREVICKEVSGGNGIVGASAGVEDEEQVSVEMSNK